MAKSRPIKLLNRQQKRERRRREDRATANAAAAQDEIRVWDYHEYLTEDGRFSGDTDDPTVVIALTLFHLDDDGDGLVEASSRQIQEATTRWTTRVLDLHEELQRELSRWRPHKGITLLRRPHGSG